MRTLRTPTVAERPIRGKVTGGAPRDTYLVRLPLGPQAPLPNSLSGCRAFVLARLLRGALLSSSLAGKCASGRPQAPPSTNDGCVGVLPFSFSQQPASATHYQSFQLQFSRLSQYVKVAGCFGPFVMNRYALCVRHTVERVNICAIRNHIAGKMSKLL